MTSPALRRRTLPVAVVLVVALGAAACSSSSSARSAPRSATTRVGALQPAVTAALHHSDGLVALGDSVPAGTKCRCTPFPGLTGSDLSQLVHPAVVVTNRAVPGYRTGDVLDQVDHDAATESAVADAALVEVEIGANDVGESDTCGTTLTCYHPAVTTMADQLGQILTRIQQLARHPQVVVVLGYWSVWLGGQHAIDRGTDYVATAEALTAEANDAIRTAAEGHHDDYVDLVPAFGGPAGDPDETALLASDGDHPNAEGQAAIADAVMDVLATT